MDDLTIITGMLKSLGYDVNTMMLGDAITLKNQILSSVERFDKGGKIKRIATEPAPKQKPKT